MHPLQAVGTGYPEIACQQPAGSPVRNTTYGYCGGPGGCTGWAFEAPLNRAGFCLFRF